VQEWSLSQTGDRLARYRQSALNVWHEPLTVYLKPYGGTWLGCASRAGLREPRNRPSFRRGLTGEKVRCPIRDACAALTRVGAKFNGEQARLDQKLFTAMTRRSAKLDK
jgi:hypothetical protein